MRSKNLSKLISALSRFSQYDNKMQLSTILTLLYVAQHEDEKEGVTTKNLQDWVGLLSGTATRNAYYWADGHKDMPNSGYGLLEVMIHPDDRRRRILKLTPKGRAFISQIEEGIGEAISSGAAER